MLPPDCFSMSAAHSLVEGTSGWAGGTQSEILSWTSLSWDSAGGAQATVPSKNASASFLIDDPPGITRGNFVGLPNNSMISSPTTQYRAHALAGATGDAGHRQPARRRSDEPDGDDDDPRRMGRLRPRGYALLPQFLSLVRRRAVGSPRPTP